MKFKVDEKVFEMLPDVCFGFVVAYGIDNTKEYPVIKGKLAIEIGNIRKKFEGKNIKEDLVINRYIEAFRKLDMNPNKFMPSILALVSRTVKGHDVPNINPIVDLGNAMSLKYLLPMGAHDLDNCIGDFEIRFSNSNDTFVSFGSNEEEIIDEEELIYVSGNEVKTRKWIWRQGEKSKIEKNTTNVIYPIDGFFGMKEDVIKARDELASLIEEIFGVKTLIGYIDKNNIEEKIDKTF